MNAPRTRYVLAHQTSALGVAYFSPQPQEPMLLGELLDRLRTCPMDDFLRTHARAELAKQAVTMLRDLFQTSDALIQALILETTMLTPALSDLWHELESRLPQLAQESAQPFLQSRLLPDHAAHSAWSLALARNIFEHVPLAELNLTSLPAPAWDIPAIHASSVADILHSLPIAPLCPRRPTTETYQLAQERLYGLGILIGPEMRHEASMSPWGLLRQWRLDRTVCSGKVSFRIEGDMTSYGRGLNLADARASLAMEIVERYSSFADIRNGKISGTAMELVLGSCSELARQTPCLDPNRMRLEVPYRDQMLHWLPGMSMDGEARLVPVQAVYLFTNLDEPALFTGLGSTGLASGNTVEEAKVSGLLEVVERDCEAVTPFTWERCFRIASDDPEIDALLQEYARQGIDPMFQDLTTELGIPCFKCFVLTKDGVAKATGASLNGVRAVISALTETPFRYPGKTASLQGPTLRTRKLEDLPDYSTGSAQGDLRLIEAILRDQNLTAYYVDLTKREMRLPVFRSIVPGLEIVSDFDRFTRINPRLWTNILKAQKTI